MGRSSSRGVCSGAAALAAGAASAHSGFADPEANGSIRGGDVCYSRCTSHLPTRGVPCALLLFTPWQLPAHSDSFHQFSL